MLAILGGIAALVLSSIFRGYVLKVVWGWFIVPTFHLVPLSIASALGISLLVGFLTQDAPDNEDKDFGEVFGKALINSLASSLVVLTLGWVYHLFV